MICPPSDEILAARMGAELSDRHPYNAASVSLVGTNENYEEAAETFARWLREGVLLQDEDPRMYVYRQDFTGPDGKRRRVAGVIGALKLEEFEEAKTTDYNGVLRHSRTIAEMVDPHLELLRTTRFNVSPVYTVYRGQGTLRSLLDPLDSQREDAGVTDANGTRHRLWVIDDPDDMEMVSHAVAPRPLVIADGHQRYEAAVINNTDHWGSDGDAYLMSLCVDADTEDVMVLPYHRVLSANASAAQIERRLEEQSPPVHLPQPMPPLFTARK